MQVFKIGDYMFSWKERLFSDSKIDKVSIVLLVVGIVGLFLSVYFGFEKYEQYSDNFYYYGYLISVFFTSVTLIFITRDYFNSSKCHVGTLKHFVIKVNPSRKGFYTAFLNNEFFCSIFFILYGIAFLTSIAEFFSAGDKRIFFFVISNFGMFVSVLVIEDLINSVKVPEKILMQIENIQDISDVERNELLRNCLREINKRSFINRGKVLHYVEAIFRSQKLTKTIEKRNADKEKERERKNHQKAEYHDFITKYKKL